MPGLGQPARPATSPLRCLQAASAGRESDSHFHRAVAAVPSFTLAAFGKGLLPVWRKNRRRPSRFVGTSAKERGLPGACRLAVSRLCWGTMGQYSDERAIWLGRHVLPHEPALRAWLRRRRLEGLEIDDVIQETYTRLVAAESVAHIRDAKSYAFQIAGSVVVDHLRRLKVVSIASVSDLDHLELPSEEPSPERQVIDREELHRLAQLIASLPGRVRDVFTLRRVYGLSQREVAERLGIAESTVEKHMARGFLLMLEPLRHGGNDTAQTSSFGSGKIGLASRDGRKDRTSD